MVERNQVILAASITLLLVAIAAAGTIVFGVAFWAYLGVALAALLALAALFTMVLAVVVSVYDDKDKED